MLYFKQTIIIVIKESEAEVDSPWDTSDEDFGDKMTATDQKDLDEPKNPPKYTKFKGYDYFVLSQDLTGLFTNYFISKVFCSFIGFVLLDDF